MRRKKAIDEANIRATQDEEENAKISKLEAELEALLRRKRKRENGGGCQTDDLHSSSASEEEELSHSDAPELKRSEADQGSKRQPKRFTGPALSRRFTSIQGQTTRGNGRQMRTVESESEDDNKGFSSDSEAGCNDEPTGSKVSKSKRKIGSKSEGSTLLGSDDSLNSEENVHSDDSHSTTDISRSVRNIRHTRRNADR
jgi:hypothetical protein